MLRSVPDKYIEGQGKNEKLGTLILKGIEYAYIVHTSHDMDHRAAASMYVMSSSQGQTLLDGHSCNMGCQVFKIGIQN